MLSCLANSIQSVSQVADTTVFSCVVSYIISISEHCEDHRDG